MNKDGHSEILTYYWHLILLRKDAKVKANAVVNAQIGKLWYFSKLSEKKINQSVETLLWHLSRELMKEINPLRKIYKQ